MKFVRDHGKIAAMVKPGHELTAENPATGWRQNLISAVPASS